MNPNERAIALVCSILLLIFFTVLMTISTAEGCFFVCN